MTYHPPQIQRRGILKPVLEHLVRRSLNVIPRSSFLDWRVERLQQFINAAHGKLGSNLDHTCKQLDLGISGSHGARLFKKHIGLGVREYAKRKRLALAADELKNTTLSVKEIAADLGYRSQTDLSRQFKHLFWLTPTEFRMALRQAVCQNVLHDGVKVTPEPREELLLEAKSGT